MGRPHTTIGAERFHFRVRNGIGWFPLAIAARKTGLGIERYQLPSKKVLARQLPLKQKGNWYLLTPGKNNNLDSDVLVSHYSCHTQHLKFFGVI